MRIEITDSLDSLEVFADPFEQQMILGAREPVNNIVSVAQFQEPVLLTDTARIGQLPGGLRDAVFALYQSYPRTVSYQGVAVTWSPTEYPRVWCPSIDTIFLAKGLSRYLNGVKNFAEIGCGSGYLTKFALRFATQLEKAVATDISVEAIRCARDAIADEPNKSKVSFVMPDTNTDTLGLQGAFDLIVTNPPYIPRPNEGHDNPYEGLDVVHKLSREAKQLLNPGGQIIINLSSLAGNTPLEWFQEAGLAVEPLETLKVPLKVNPVTSGVLPESQNWLAYLAEKGLIDEDEHEENGYRYWHTLRLYRLCFK